MSETPTFHEVTQAWDVAPVEAIHPLRSKSDVAYWDSGRAQAVDAAKWIPDGGVVMDFGCGDGRVTIPLARMGFHVLAVDASANMLKRIAHNLDKEEPGLSVHLIRSNGSDLNPYSVDAVVCRAVLIHHNHEDAAALVTALAGVLRDGGHLIADWPTGSHYVRRNWTDVTTWKPEHRLAVATDAGLELVDDATPSVWTKV